MAYVPPGNECMIRRVSRKIVASTPAKCHACGEVAVLSTSADEVFHPHPPHNQLELVATAYFSQCTACGLAYASLDQLKRSLESQHYALHQHLTSHKDDQ